MFLQLFVLRIVSSIWLEICILLLLLLLLLLTIIIIIIITDSLID